MMIPTQPTDHTVVFIAGLHRSGTSILHRCLRDHPSISGFQDTGVPEDEGQHLQSVYPAALAHGGPGRFGFDPEARLDETSSLVSESNRTVLWEEWTRHWDLEKPVLVEKSPPNLIRTRFLQAMFPDSRFIVLLRHPIAVSLATQKWSWTTISSLLRHWLTCHELFEQDRPHLAHCSLVHYETLATCPQRVLDRIYGFLQIETHTCTEKVLPDVNAKYFSRWRQRAHGFLGRRRMRRLADQFERRANRFGYSLIDLD